MGKYTTAVTAASTPQQAMAFLAAGIDAILSKLDEQVKDGPDLVSWQTWSTAEAPNASSLMTVQDVSEDERIVELASVSEEKKELRRMFANQSLRLEAALGDCPDERGWTELYAIGGPLWLYAGNRDLVMSYPSDIRARMVADVEESDPDTAQEMGRDVLKFAGETGPGGTAMLVADQL